MPALRCVENANRPPPVERGIPRAFPSGGDGMNRRPERFEINEEAWRLRGSKSTFVECRITQTVSKLYALTVVSGSETFLDEIYPDATSAKLRATQVRDRLLGSGDWTSVSDRRPLV
jgi:hypothetical protein